MNNRPRIRIASETVKAASCMCRCGCRSVLGLTYDPGIGEQIMDREDVISTSQSSSARVVTIDREATIAAAAARMREHGIGCLIVTDAAGKLVGIFSERDVVYGVVADCADPAEVLVKDIMITDVASCCVGTPMCKVQEIMTNRRVRHLPLVADGVPVGMISSRQVMAYRHASEQATRDLTIFALAKLADTRDPETGMHLERVRGYARALTEALAEHRDFPAQIDANFIRMIYLSSPLHDVGKVGIPDCVLLKPGRLDDQEFKVMKTHSRRGAETLDLALKRYPEAGFLHMARDIAAYHHERYDGQGYPDGLAGEDIPLCARIFAISDVYDALVSKRVYKDAVPHDIARSIIIDGKGTQFDPVAVEAFVRCEKAFEAIREECDSTRTAA